MTKKIKYNDIEVYPNSPLVEVICEIRFPGDLSIDCHRDIFHNEIKDDYPIILVPGIIPGTSFALEPYHFENEDKNAGIMLSMNKFSYYSKKYKGHKYFLKEFMRLVDIFIKTYPTIDKLNRVGWRYINVIPFGREDETLPIKHFLNVNIQISPNISDEFLNLSLISVIKKGDGTIIIKLETVKRNDQQEAFLLDFDYAIINNLNLKNIKDYVINAHEQTRILFEEMITESYREYLKGETI